MGKCVRIRATASLYDSLGLASYEAMEAFVKYVPFKWYFNIETQKGDLTRLFVSLF
jgi:hypothetical protein